MEKSESGLDGKLGDGVNGRTGVKGAIRFGEEIKSKMRSRSKRLSLTILTPHPHPHLLVERKPHSARDWIEPRATTIGTRLALAFLPAKPGFLDGIGARATIDFGQIEQFAKAAAFGTPALRRIIAEHFRVQRLERTSAA